MRCASISEFSTAAIANSERTIQSSLLAPANLPDGVVLATNSSACAIALWTVWPGSSDVDTMFTPAAFGTQLRARASPSRPLRYPRQDAGYGQLTKVMALLRTA